jgi:3-oxoadipate enol-lactonase
VTAVRIAHEVRGEGPPALLVQGLGYARWGWDPIAGPLARSFRVVTFDNRGIGDSDKPPGPYTVRLLAEDAVGVLDELGIERAHIVGASLGGMVAQELAAGWPKRVDRLVLCCTTPGDGAYPMPEQSLRLFAEAATLPPEVALHRFVANALGVGGELVEKVYRRRLANPPDPVGWEAQAAAGLGFQGVDLALVEAPTLVLHGTADNVVDVRNGELLAERIQGARLELLPGAGHLFFWERPERVVDLIRGFLA